MNPFKFWVAITPLSGDRPARESFHWVKSLSDASIALARGFCVYEAEAVLMTSGVFVLNSWSLMVIGGENEQSALPIIPFPVAQVSPDFRSPEVSPRQKGITYVNVTLGEPITDARVIGHLQFCMRQAQVQV
ncbi:MAG: hypothetical protein ABIH41_06005 [Nanoarchaeota archaeon]